MFCPGCVGFADLLAQWPKVRWRAVGTYRGTSRSRCIAAPLPGPPACVLPTPLLQWESPAARQSPHHLDSRCLRIVCLLRLVASQLLERNVSKPEGKNDQIQQPLGLCQTTTCRVKLCQTSLGNCQGHASEASSPALSGLSHNFSPTLQKKGRYDTTDTTDLKMCWSPWTGFDNQLAFIHGIFATRTGVRNRRTND